MGSRYLLPGLTTSLAAPNMKDAACREAPWLPWVPDTFSSNTVRTAESELAEMRRICQSCVHLIECREYALSDASIYGVWGGLTSGDRREMRAGRRPIPR